MNWILGIRGSFNKLTHEQPGFRLQTAPPLTEICNLSSVIYRAFTAPSSATASSLTPRRISRASTAANPKCSPSRESCPW